MAEIKAQPAYKGKPACPETLRQHKSNRIYSINMPETFEDIYLSSYIRQFRSFSAFVRTMLQRGLEVEDDVAENSISCGTVIE